MTTRCLIGVVVAGGNTGLAARLVTEAAVCGAAFAPVTVVPTATPAPITVAAAMAA